MTTGVQLSGALYAPDCYAKQFELLKKCLEELSLQKGGFIQQGCRCMSNYIVQYKISITSSYSFLQLAASFPYSTRLSRLNNSLHC